jgi:outer membrane protein OmpA-like peptidoglycan-associated protein
VRPATPPTHSAPARAPTRPLADVLDRIYFKENEAALDGGEDALNAFADLASDNGVTLVVIAHADAAEQDPQRVSTRRAELVKQYLITRGVPTHRLRVRAVGASEPLRRPSAETQVGATNRCVQLAVEKRAR